MLLNLKTANGFAVCAAGASLGVSPSGIPFLPFPVRLRAFGCFHSRIIREKSDSFSSIFSLFFVVSMKSSFGFSSLRPDIINVFSCSFLFSASC